MWAIVSASETESRRAAVPELCQYPMFFVRLGLALSEKQVPQVNENTEEKNWLLEPLESVGTRPRQARYQAALRPDMKCVWIIRDLQTRMLLQQATNGKISLREALLGVR